ncbi:MAG: hypothetical protein AMJ55_08635, partial [Gammaproteobacteria bacterium SG8_15]
PNIGLSGLLAASVAFIITRLWQFPDYAGHLQIFNALLVGLSIGAFYVLNIYIVGIIIAGAIVAVFVSTVLGDALWRSRAVTRKVQITWAWHRLPIP